MTGPSSSWTLPPVLIGVPAIFGLVGSLFVVIGLRSRAALRRFRRTAARAPGVVLDLVLELGGGRQNGSWLYFPIVRYSLPDGRAVDFKSPQGSAPAAVRKGQQVTVLYDPANPANARLEGILSGGCLYGFLAVFGVAFVLLAIAIAAGSLLVDRVINP